MGIVLFVALACASGALVSLVLHFGERKRRQTDPITIDLNVDTDQAEAALRRIKMLAEEVERTFGRIEVKQERVLGAVRDARQSAPGKQRR